MTHLEMRTGFALRLYNLRMDRDAGHKQIAAKVGVNRRTYTSWESGVCLPKAYRLWQLAKLFGVTMEYLLTGR